LIYIKSSGLTGCLYFYKFQLFSGCFFSKEIIRMIMQASAQTSVSTRASKAPAFRRSRLAAAIGITGMMLVAGMSGSAFAAKGGTPGKPVDAGGAPDLGDLIVLQRDAWGVPILTGDLCQQPLAAPGVTLPAVGDIPACIPASETESCVIPVDPATCAIVAGYETYTQEVDFGRTSVIRSPVTVIEQSLGEVVTKLATAQCTTLDPAGRLVNTSKIGDEVFSATIDSPLESLAIYWQLMKTGDLGVPLPEGADVLDTAARGLGAATDKTGKVTVDQVVYSNQIMGLTNENVQTYLPKICMNVREEVSGTVQTVRKCFLNYGDEHPDYASVGGTIADYEYDRALNFGALPAPPYIPEGEGLSMAGWFEYLGVYDDTHDPVLFSIVQAAITPTVFGTDPGFLDGNIGGFTQAADDAREVIEFTHDRPLPLGYETAVPLCDVPDTDVVYDLSISEQSGLQVPKQIVDGSEGREFTVSVANAGPDAASGIVRVTAEAANGVPIEDSPWEFEFNDLVGGASQSWTEFFSIDLGARTTIAWTATAIADCADCDLNTGNNTVTASSNVRVTGSGGGGQGGPAAPATPSASSNGKSGK
jgi:hypothetical protein